MKISMVTSWMQHTKQKKANTKRTQSDSMYEVKKRN